MHLILTGATGMVGTAILDGMLRTNDVTRISILSRRPVRFADEVQDPRVNVILHKDFSSYDTPTLQEQLKDAQGCVWALGSTSTTQVTPEEYRTATRDYGIEAARVFAKLGTERKPFRFVYISGEGATQTPGMTASLYARVKGEAEGMLTKLAEEQPSLMVVCARVGGVDGAGHEAMQKYGPERILMHRILGTTLMPALKLFYGKMHTPTVMLGDVCTQLAMGMLDGKLEGDGAIHLGTRSWALHNWGLQRLAKK